ncbi:MAG: hypothetical protein D6784_03315 [Chloroflexi bacterium]|nr:MAG: hypothetical protein D6784_03315 [Chloroflexota bacterium]
MQAPSERLGSFYLGAEYDLDTGKILDMPINYDARDLTTHAVCVGMTGSGKTGLCIDLLEEAAIDQVPTILIDPKGDITNLMLRFPELRPEDFLPWVNVDDARRKGMSVEEYAQSIAEKWRSGLANWGIGPERIRRLEESGEVTIYTPGSNTGIPISIMSSLAAPGLDFATEAEAIRERINGTVVALLGLVGIDADPIRSREAILLANIFEHFWQKNEDLDLARLIMSIQNPPVRQIGVFDVETFFPEKDRFELAMALNNLVASPTFKSWLEGEALDIDRLLYTDEGRPRHNIFYIAHLSDSERMFFVTLLLGNILTWVRRQPGTTSLRAILYFDEVFGFMPPTAEPPSKRPLLTLLKQARAFGLGCVLVTQNPVDIDYKGLTNAGTWFIGKLQAERDKARVLQGLQSAISEAGGGGKDVDFDSLLSRLGSRVFLLHNVHEDEPVVFHTRWAMSYLRGPLTRLQVEQLMAGRKQAAPSLAPDRPRARPAVAASVQAAAEEEDPTPPGYLPTPPAAAPNVPQKFLPLALDERAAIRQLEEDSPRALDVRRVQLVYEPALVAAASVRFVDRKRKIDEQTRKVLVTPAPEEGEPVDWELAESLPITLRDLDERPARVDANQGPFFAPIPGGVNTARELKSIERDLSDWLYYNSRITIKVHPDLDVFQRPGESERAFKIRLQQAARERRDEEVDKLEKKYDTRISRLETRLRKYRRELAQDEAEYEARKREEVLSLGESVASFFFGRRRTSALSSAARKRRMTSRAKQEIEETKEEIAELEAEIAELEEELKEQADEITRKWAETLDVLETEEIGPRRSDVDIQVVAVGWLPSWRIVYDDGRGAHSATIPAYPMPDVEE